MSINNDQIIRGVKNEVLRTIPFWRCYLDLKCFFNRTPVVESLETVVQSRESCTQFPGVDVVWAVTTAVLRVQIASLSSTHHKRPRDTSNPVSPSSSGVTNKSSRNFGGLVKSWRGVPSEAFTFTLGTMHFVHSDGSTSGGERSFHIQSVYLYEKPQRLQCVAGVMVHFALVLHSGVKIMQEVRKSHKSIFEVCKDIMGISAATPLTNQEQGNSSDVLNAEEYGRPAKWFPSSTARVLILGMGGNSMAVALRYILGPMASIDVVEIEPAVAKVCQTAGTLLQDDGKHHAHIEDAHNFMKRKNESLEDGSKYDFIFMDLFEPLEAQMEVGETLVHQCYKLLSEGGALVVNEHILPDPKHLVLFTQLFGDGLVHAVNLHGWKESVVVGFRRTSDDNNQEAAACIDAEVSLSCSKQTARVVHGLYERWLPGILPDIDSWLLSMRTFNKSPQRCRIWES